MSQIKTLVLSALEANTEVGNNIKSSIVSQMQKQEFHMNWFDMRDMNIRNCVGCGSCGAKTPGLCPQKDDMQKLYPKMVEADLIIFVTPISFGGYHSELRKALDRLMTMKLGLYRIYKGELHHKNRYDKIQSLFTVGILPNKDQNQERIFATLTERNAINLLITSYGSVSLVVDSPSDEVATKIQSGLRKVIGE